MQLLIIEKAEEEIQEVLNQVVKALEDLKVLEEEEQTGVVEALEAPEEIVLTEVEVLVV